MNSPVVVIGAGLAGLTCARHLHRNGVEAVVLEKDLRVGGRLKTDVVDGYRMDHGLQVYFEAYPAGRVELDLPALDLRAYPSGALIRHEGEFHVVDRSNPISTAFDPLISSRDKVLVFEFTRDCMGMSLTQIWRTPDRATRLALRQYGFSPEFLDRFAKPFFGGIFMDRDLNVSFRMFLFVWKMLAEGRTVVPATGIQAIPEQIAGDLAEDTIRFGAEVESLSGTEVRLSDGETVNARCVVVATDASSATRLTGIPTIDGWVGQTCLYYAVPEIPLGSKAIILTTDPGLVQMVTPVTAVVPECAPAGAEMVSVTVLGEKHEDLDHLDRTVRLELSEWFPVPDWRLLKTFPMPHCQFAQPPGFNEHLPGNTPGVNGVYFAGEFTRNSSINGALESGRSCARMVLEDLGVLTALPAAS